MSAASGKVSRMILAGALVFFALALGLSGCATQRLESRHPPIGDFVEVDGVNIHLRDLGPRDSALPPIVLIHGASANLRDMELALGEAFATERRVLIVDRPGRGYSERGKEGRRLSEQARLIHGAVTARGAERPIILGQSFGGAVALAYGLGHQDEIAGLVLLAAVSHEWPGGVAWYHHVSGWPVIGAAFRRLVIPAYGPRAAQAGVAETFEPNDAPEDYYERAGVGLLFRPSDFAANSEDIRHLKRQVAEMSGRYDTLTLPIAILTGADDTTVSPILHSKALSETVNPVVYEVLPDTGHALHHIRKSEIIAAVEAVTRAAEGR